jgi:hypothetical protein
MENKLHFLMGETEKEVDTRQMIVDISVSQYN